MKPTKLIIASLAALSFSAFANSSVVTPNTQANNICAKNQTECVKHNSAAQCEKVAHSCMQRMAKREQALRNSQKQHQNTQATQQPQQTQTN